MKTIDWNSHEGMLLSEALYNCTDKGMGPDHADVAWGHGILVGVVAGLMYGGFAFDEVWEQIIRNVPVATKCKPPSWPDLSHYDAKETDLCQPG